MKPAFALLLGLALSLTACKDPIEQFAPQSDFAFSGTVQLINSSTIHQEEATGLAVVRVDKVLMGSTPFTNFSGQQITVRLKDPSAMKEGVQRVFFTNGWHFSESLGVVEIGSFETSESFERMQEKVNRVKQQHRDRLLRERIDRAELIVRGRVVKVSRKEGPAEASEHTADWHEAEIEVDKVLKGAYTQKRITILFPMSRDIMWYSSPKFQKDMEGLWLLKRPEIAGKKLDLPSALEKDDFYTKDAEDEIIRLIN